MKNKYFILGMLAGVLALSLVIAGCDTGTGGSSGGIDTKWQGRYVGGTDYVILTGTTARYKIGSSTGSMPNITMGTGGNVMASGRVAGSWMYVLSDGNTIGFVMDETVTPGIYVGVGEDGADSLIRETRNRGGSFSPSPSTSNLPTTYYFWGQKQ
jgi:hypothetical protein